MMRPKTPETIEVAVWQPIECNPRVLERCEGVPKQSYASRTLLSLGLGWALRRLDECQDKHAEMAQCFADHNAKAAENNAKAK